MPLPFLDPLPASEDVDEIGAAGVHGANAFYRLHASNVKFERQGLPIRLVSFSGLENMAKFAPN